MKIYAEVTDKIIAELERGSAPWIKPWNAGQSADHNLVSGKAYQGVNRIILAIGAMAGGFTSSTWATYKQFAAAGAQVRKGEKSTHIIYFQPVVKKASGPEGEDETFALMKSYCVFNADQVDGLPVKESEPVKEFEALAHCEQTIAGTGAIITHSGDQAFYRPSTDSINLPQKTAFDSPANYYATAFHELTHWTGAKTRLDRVQLGKYSKPEYAFEELVAEMGAAFLCAEHGIAGDLRHAGYIQGWLQCLKNDSKAIFKAAALAEKAAGYITKSAQVEDKMAA